MKDLYKGFKKISEDDSKAILEHDNGHQLSIAKSGLSKQQKHALSRLPLHQAKGTRPVEEVQGPTQNLKQAGANIADAVASKMIEGATEAATPATMSPEEIAKMPEPVATDVQTGMPVAKGVGGMSPEEKYLSALGPQKPVVSPLDIAKAGLQPGAGTKSVTQLQQGLQQQQEQAPKQLASEAEPTLAPEPTEVTPPPVAELVAAPVAAAAPKAPTMAMPAAPVRERQPEEILMDPKAELSDKLAAQNMMYMRNLKEFQDSRQKEKEILSKMEPKRVFSDASLGNKILMAISAIAGGVGAGLTGRENAALRAMDDIFQRDWEAQKAEQTNKLNLHRANVEFLKDEMSARLQTMANMKNIMLAKMEEAEGKYGFGTPAQKRLELARLQVQSDIERLNDELASRRTNSQVRSALAQLQPAGAQQVVSQRPAAILPTLVKDEGLRKEVRKEINRREAIAKNAPIALAALDETVQAMSGIKGLATLAKPPEALKKFRLAVRGLIPEQAGTDGGLGREAQVKALLDLLEPSLIDVKTGDAPQIRERLIGWLSENTSTPAADEAGIDLNRFESTRIDPASWRKAEAGNQTMMQLPNGQRIMVPTQNVEAAKQKLKAKVL